MTARLRGSVFLVACAGVTYEVALTRVFAVVLQYHFAFLAVSLAICGLGLGGLALHLRLRNAAAPVALAPAALAFCGTSVVALVALLGWVFPRHIDAYWLAGAVVLVPFACAGWFLAAAFASAPERGAGIYAADLFGAASGSLGALALLQLAGGINACLAAAALAALAAAACASTVAWRRASVLAAAGLAAVAVANRGAVFLDVPAVRLDPRTPAARSLAQPLFAALAGPPESRPTIVETTWDAFARTDVVEEPAFGPDRKDVFHVYTNGNVPTNLFRVRGDLRSGDARSLIRPLFERRLLDPLANLAFAVRPRERVLCLGPGGGMDVLLALAGGAREVEGAELNPAIPRMMHRWAGFNGHLYERAGVRVVTAEARAYVRRADREYDLIYAALTQTSVGTQAMTYMESYVHTLEAVEDYWSHLAPRGELALVVHELPYALRLVATAAEVLKREGLSDAQALGHVSMVLGRRPPYAFLVLLQRSPYTDAESAALRRYAAQHGLEVFLAPPGRDGYLGDVLRGKEPLSRLLDSTSASVFGARAVDLTPVTDDRPFFLDVSPGVPAALWRLLTGAGLLVGAFSVFALVGRRRDRARPAWRVAPFALYFAALGAGFMLVEIPLLQKLVLPLGHPTLALSITLFALLIGGAAGSAASQRVDATRLVGLAALASLLGAALIAAGSLALAEPMRLLAWPLPARIAIAGAGLAALGAVLGVPFPSGIRLLARSDSAEVPWMWGVNGVMSVVGSLIAVILAKPWGFAAVLRLGALVYAVLGLALVAVAVAGRRGRRVGGGGGA